MSITNKMLKEEVENRIKLILSEAKLDKFDKETAMKDFDDIADKDLDNDGEVDDQDEYLHNRRKKVTKIIQANESAYGKRSIEDLMSMRERDLKSIEKMPKNAKYSQYADVIDREYMIRKELMKRGEKVSRPKHPLIIESE